MIKTFIINCEPIDEKLESRLQDQLLSINGVENVEYVRNINLVSTKYDDSKISSTTIIINTITNLGIIIK